MHSKHIAQLIEHFVPNGIGVEIGINRGATSTQILRGTTRHLYMIDPWMRNYDPNQGLYSTKENPDKDHAYVVKYFREHFSDKHTIIRKKSEDACNDVPDNLDFVFIDGNHSYEFIAKDLQMWVPKVRSGGLVSGHDWWGKFPGVIAAVTEFFEANDVLHPPNRHFMNHIPAPHAKPIVMKTKSSHIWWGNKK